MDELEISGKRFISSKRAAKENRYHVDYIGQLIRGGKVIGSKVGRSWYVEEQSLAEYLGKEVSTQNTQKLASQKPVVVEVREEEVPAPVQPLPRAEVRAPIFEAKVRKEEVAAPLRYISDEEPLMQPIQNDDWERQEVIQGQETHIEASEPSKAPSFLRGATVALLFGVIVFACTAGASYFFSYRSVISKEGNTAAVSFGL